MYNTCYMNIFKHVTLDREPLSFFLPVKLHSQRRKTFLTVSEVIKGSFWWKWSLSRTLLANILIGTYYNHDTHHLLSVCYEGVSILGALNTYSCEEEGTAELSMNTLKLYWKFCVYVSLYIFMGKGSRASRNTNHGRESSTCDSWTLRNAHIGGWQVERRIYWGQRSCERLRIGCS